MTKEYRELSEYEKNLLEKLLSKEFPGNDILKQQLSTAQVKTIDYSDNWGSLEFKIHGSQKASVSSRVPVQAITKDTDGIPVEIFLHVVDGLIDELEIIKADDSPILDKINSEDLKVITYSNIKKD